MLSEPATRERVLIGLAAISSPSRALIIKETVPVPEEAFLGGTAAAWSHKFTMEQVDRARSVGAGICVLHTHGGSGLPGLSGTDRRSIADQAASIQSLYPETLVASVVTSGDWHASGVVYREHDQGVLAIDSARWLNHFIEVLPAPGPPSSGQERGLRHLPVWGEVGEARVRNARLGVVGLGGGGSHVVQQLAHLGVRDVVGVDADLLERHNRSRVVGTEDADIGKKKLRAMKRLVRLASGGATRFTAVDDRFPAAQALAALSTCDVIVGCVDKHHVRKDLQAFAWQHAVPLVDIGLTIQPTGLRFRPEIGGQVFIGLPGGPCMWCARVLTEAALAADLDENGYVRDGGDAQVVSLNGVLASQAVTEVLNLLTGFQVPEGLRSPAKLIFDGRGLMPVGNIGVKPGCSTCSSVGSGDVTWRSTRRHDAEGHADRG